MASLGFAPLGEVTLKNNRRADVMGVAENGEIMIVEIKSCLADFRSDRKWPDYLAYADRFYFAVDQAFPSDVLPIEEGLIMADSFGGAILREARQRPMASARRRSLLLRFARMAAGRLHGIDDPQGYRA